MYDTVMSMTAPKPTPHQTVVAIFIRDRKLLMDQRGPDRSVYPNLLMCPSGHLLDDESKLSAIRREMKEELSIRVHKAQHLFSLPDTDQHSGANFLHHFMLIEGFTGRIKTTTENLSLHWYSAIELDNMTLAPIVRQLLDKLIAKKILI